MTEFNFREFQKVIEELSDDIPNYREDDYLALWFLRAYATDNIELAKKAITGSKGDKGNDAISLSARGLACPPVNCLLKPCL